MEKHIYFVRHGESEGNVSGVFHGHDVDLTEKGREQAALVAKRVERLNIDALITSPFPRAVSTAQAISEQMGISIEQSDLFTEWIPPSSFIGKSREDPETKKELEIISDSTDNDYRHSDEETFSELMVRAKNATNFLEIYEGENICVVTHGGFIRLLVGLTALRSSFTKGNFKAMIRNFRLYNTGITHLKYNSEKGWWQLITWNDQVHLG